MNDHPDRVGRLQLIESMFVGHSWQSAVAKSQLKISRSTAYRRVQLARKEEKAAVAFLDDRHGHPYKLTESGTSVARRGMHQKPAVSFQQDSSRVEDQRLLWPFRIRSSGQCHLNKKRGSSSDRL